MLVKGATGWLPVIILNNTGSFMIGPSSAWWYIFSVLDCASIGLDTTERLQERYPPEMHLKCKFYKNSFTHNSLLSCQIILNILCRAWQYQYHTLCKLSKLTTENDGPNRCNFIRFEFKKIFEQMSYIATASILPRMLPISENDPIE